eukprot:9531740-Alexandrium_andersonii.AAC.1
MPAFGHLVRATRARARTGACRARKCKWPVNGLRWARKNRFRHPMQRTPALARARARGVRPSPQLGTTKKQHLPPPQESGHACK